MRKIYQYMSMEDKVKTLELLRVDITGLEMEIHNNYPRVVKDAITDTLRRYQAEEKWLSNEVEDKSD
ncbi:hypothetical protein [Jeotgalibacillus proteolyticus]|uniref:Uncharacterized protein n=1 Tax=Jeotgalibacillus proteolyticus TaxID=2082395 RepID=A0A2S5G942_9BACL|nr:hypothetical protein [Jeotgalibacillus proteolyticus]PPA69527.1 hypothetical protein C4B60_13330 [Jeotgalibacillus proteolyticus]